MAKRLAVHGLDKIYSSTSNRASMTATPTCEILKKKPELLDFANENHAWRELTVEREDGYSVPKILTLSSEAHIYREGLPTKYNNYLYY